MIKYILIHIDEITDGMINKSLMKSEVLYGDYRLLKVSANYTEFKGYRKYTKQQVDSEILLITNNSVKIKNKVISETDSTSYAFASKKLPNGKSLFKRVHGINSTIAANSNGNIDLIIPYAQCKFSGADIFGCALKDKVDFMVLDTANNDISGLSVATYGANFMLNQFGFNVEMKADDYSNTSNYDADLFQGMVLRCVYKNQSSDPLYVSVNFELHEVK